MATDTRASKGPNWWLWGGGGLAVVVVILAGLYGFGNSETEVDTATPPAAVQAQ